MSSIYSLLVIFTFFQDRMLLWVKVDVKIGRLFKSIQTANNPRELLRG